MAEYEPFDLYEDFAYQDRTRSTHRARRGKDPRPDARHYRQRKAGRMAEMSDRADQFVPSYVANLDPQHHERQWVIDSLSGFYVNNQLADVLHLVKGGKEANVYCCQGTDATGGGLLAAKLYRPRMLRHLKNNALYKEGRFLRDSEGKLIKGAREDRAMLKKTSFGQKLDLAAWIMHEFGIQQQLHVAGGDVPRPVAQGGNTILMEYFGEAALAAPTLHEVRLEAVEARALFDRVWHNVELMLQHHLIHGDLSAFNILYWQGRIAVIDFPQTIDARTNRNAPALLRRDVQRVCEYFAGYDIHADPVALADDLWHRYMNAAL